MRRVPNVRMPGVCCVRVLIFSTSDGESRRLCPGEYTVRGCETKEANLKTRAENIRKIIDDVTDVAADCYSSGLRDESRPRCTTNFPKFIHMELAAHVELG